MMRFSYRDAEGSRIYIRSSQDCPDGRCKIRLLSKEKVIKFMSDVGSSNLRHIVRFLLWNIDRYEAKIEIEGLPSLIEKTNKLTNTNIEEVALPFLWVLDNKPFKRYVENDLEELQGAEIRNLYKWSELTKNLIKRVGTKELAYCFNIRERSIRKWRQGTRIPSNKFISRLTELSENNNLDLENYKV